MAEEKFCLRWNDYEKNLRNSLRSLKDDNELLDVTLCCEDEQVKAHKVILSACSQFFKNIFCQNVHQHPIVYLKGIKMSHFKSVLDFMYYGDVSVAQSELNPFLAVADDLKVKGLIQNDAPKTLNQNMTNLEEKRRHILKPKPVEIPVKIEENDPIQVYDGESIVEENLMIMAADDNGPETEDIYYDDSQYNNYTDGNDYQDSTRGWKFSPNEIDYQNQIESFIDKTDQGYQCIKCGYSSMRKFNLKKHVETHMETLGYQCPLCNKQCKTKNSLDVHNSTFHRGNKR